MIVFVDFWLSRRLGFEPEYPWMLVATVVWFGATPFWMSSNW